MSASDIPEYAPVDENQIYVGVCVDDPKALMKAYSRGMTLTRVWQPGYQQLQYACTPAIEPWTSRKSETSARKEEAIERGLPFQREAACVRDR